MADQTKGDEVLRALGGQIGRYLSELYHRVEELERKLQPAESLHEQVGRIVNELEEEE